MLSSLSGGINFRIIGIHMSAERYHTHPVMITYYALLEGVMPRHELHAHVIHLIARNPYFFALHIEVLDMLKGLGKEAEWCSFLEFSNKVLRELLAERALFGATVALWTERDRDDACALAALVAQSKRFSPTSFAALFAKLAFASVQARPFPHERRGLNLKLERCCDVAELQTEIVRAEPWWCASVDLDLMVGGVGANVIPLRTKSSKEEDPMLTNGYGSERAQETGAARFFPRALAIAEEFAANKDGYLGVAALVRFKSRMKAGPWYGVPNIKGPARYHVVAQSPRGSVAMSGVERQVFHEGDLFFLENRKMNAITHDAGSWCTHLVFDVHTPADRR